MSRFIVLTGATRGLGRALLDHFVAAGHRVAGCGSNAGLVAELADRFPTCTFAAVDVTDGAAVSRWAASVLATSTPDLLVNNAAVMNEPAELWNVSAAEFDRLLAVNVSGVANVLRAFLPAMVTAKSGVIVNLSSLWGRSTSPKVAPYCATKYAIEGLTKALAQELPTGMAAVPLNPGVIDTDMLRQVFGDGAAKYNPASKWAERAAPFILGLGAGDNGKSLSVPG